MPENYKKIYQGQLSNTAGTLYTVPSATQTIVKAIRIVNTDASARTAKLWHDGTGDANVILPTCEIKAGGWGEFDGVITLEAADTLSGEASVASKLTVTIYGLEIS